MITYKKPLPAALIKAKLFATREARKPFSLLVGQWHHQLVGEREGARARCRFEKRRGVREGERASGGGRSGESLRQGPLGSRNTTNPSLRWSSSPAMAAPAPDRAALTVGPGMDMPIMHDSDRYELVRDIGSGNFGVARLMRDRRTSELVAVKYIERGEKVWRWSRPSSPCGFDSALVVFD